MARRNLRWLHTAGAVAALLGAETAFAAGQFIEDIQVSRRGDEATVTISLACPMRFQSDASTPAGVLLEIRVAPLDSCRQLGIGDGIASEVYRPASGRLASLTEVEYESLGLGDNLLLLHFDRPVAYRVAQRGDLRTLELRVRTTGDAPVTSTVPTPAPAPSAPRAPATAPPASPQAAPPSGRAPLSARVRNPDVAADYILNLQSTREPVDPAVVASLPVTGSQRAYVSTTAIAGVTWYRLRIGFFASEQEAGAALGALAARFPRAWVGRAEAEEVSAANQASQPGAVVAERASEAVAATEAAPSVAGAALPPERIAEMLAQGRAAIVAGDFEGAIRLYSRLLEQPGEHSAEARENLGIAREKNGQTAHAAAEYRRFLQDYPEATAAARVRQRLNGLVTANEPRDRLRDAQGEQRWDITTGVSQYYRRDLNRFDEDQPEVVTLSALLTDLDFSIKHRGDAIDMLGRITINHLHDLIGEEDGGPGDRRRISYAYVDLSGVQDDWSMRMGRQSLHNWGVLGRFDGAHGIYDWAERRRLHVVAGYPVESTLRSVETNREFLGAAVDFEHLLGQWTFSPFVMEQTIEGITDREAAGLEVTYLDEQRSLTTMLDYDFAYGKINTALVFGTWRLNNRVTLTGLYDDRSSPVLTTRNALIGQPISTIDEMLLVWTEDEIRQIALDRTTTSRTMTFGVAAPLAERWQLNADVTTTEIDGSIASAGVAALPATGVQTYYSTSFVGSALFGTNDVSIFNLRYGESEEFTTAQLTWDLRLPVGRKLRINPRLRFGVYEGLLTNRRRETVTPSLRLLVNTARHYRLEVELGTDRMNRSDGVGEQKATGTFFNLGYRADF